MSLPTWRRVYRWLRVAYCGTWIVAGVLVLRGADISRGNSATIFRTYLAVWGVYLLCGATLRAAERREPGLPSPSNSLRYDSHRSR